MQRIVGFAREGVDPSIRVICGKTGVLTPIPDPSPLEGEGSF